MVLVHLSLTPLAHTGSQGAPGPEVSLLAKTACGSGQQSWELTAQEQSKCQLLSHIRLFATQLTVTCQAPLSMGFSRQEYWSGWPCPSPGDLPDPGIEPGSPALQGDSFLTEPPGKPSNWNKGAKDTQICLRTSLLSSSDVPSLSVSIET